MKCFYHSADLDGHCSGAIIKYKYPHCEMIGIDYGNKFPWRNLYEDTGKIFMVDFSLQPFEKMVQLERLSDNRLTWIDHHKSSIEALKDWNNNHKEWLSINGLRRIGIGACALVWEYLFALPIPKAIQLLAEYDVWDLHDPETLPFQYGMRLYDTKPENQCFWKSLFEEKDYYDPIIREGRTCLTFTSEQNRKYCEINAIEVEFDGLKCIALNLGKPYISSQTFESIWDSSKYDAMLGFCRLEDKWTVSIYTDNPDIDLSIIAKARGGGGHKSAAGFQCKELPWMDR